MAFKYAIGERVCLPYTHDREYLIIDRKELGNINLYEVEGMARYVVESELSKVQYKDTMEDTLYEVKKDGTTRRQ